VSEEEYRAYAEGRRKKRLPAESRPDEIRITGDVPPKLQAALKKAILPIPGEVVDEAKLEDQMLKLTGAGRFDTAGYEFLREQNQEILHIEVGERPYGRTFLKPALFVEGASGEGMRFG